MFDPYIKESLIKIKEKERVIWLENAHLKFGVRNITCEGHHKMIPFEGHLKMTDHEYPHDLINLACI